MPDPSKVNKQELRLNRPRRETPRQQKVPLQTASGVQFVPTGTDLTSITVSAAIKELWGRTVAALITTRGDIIRGDSAGAAERLPLGAGDEFLGSDGLDALWRIVEAGIVQYDNSISGLLAMTVQNAIDELASGGTASDLVVHNSEFVFHELEPVIHVGAA